MRLSHDNTRESTPKVEAPKEQPRLVSPALVSNQTAKPVKAEAAPDLDLSVFSEITPEGVAVMPLASNVGTLHEKIRAMADGNAVVYLSHEEVEEILKMPRAGKLATFGYSEAKAEDRSYGQYHGQCHPFYRN